MENHTGGVPDGSLVGDDLWPSRRDPCRNVSGENQIHLHVDTLSYRRRLFWRVLALHLSVYRGADGATILRTLVHGRGYRFGVGCGVDLAAGNFGKDQAGLTGKGAAARGGE